MIPRTNLALHPTVVLFPERCSSWLPLLLRLRLRFGLLLVLAAALLAGPESVQGQTTGGRRTRGASGTSSYPGSTEVG